MLVCLLRQDRVENYKMCATANTQTHILINQQVYLVGALCFSECVGELARKEFY